MASENFTSQSQTNFRAQIDRFLKKMRGAIEHRIQKPGELTAFVVVAYEIGGIVGKLVGRATQNHSRFFMLTRCPRTPIVKPSWPNPAKPPKSRSTSGVNQPR